MIVIGAPRAVEFANETEKIPFGRLQTRCANSERLKSSRSLLVFHGTPIISLCLPNSLVGVVPSITLA